MGYIRGCVSNDWLLWQYIAMYSDIGQKSNTMIFSDRPADVNALMAQAAAVIGTAQPKVLPREGDTGSGSS